MRSPEPDQAIKALQTAGRLLPVEPGVGQLNNRAALRFQLIAVVAGQPLLLEDAHDDRGDAEARRAAMSRLKSSTCRAIRYQLCSRVLKFVGYKCVEDRCGFGQR